MLSIRESVFETNSSSCHSISFNCSQEELKDFNDGKLFYTEFTGKGFLTNKSMLSDFHTAEEIVNKLKQDIDVKSVDLSRSYFSDGDFDIWDYSEEDIQDQTNFVEWFVNNLTADMLIWAFSDDPKPKYFSRKIIKTTLQLIVDNIWYSPLWGVKDFFSLDGEGYSSLRISAEHTSNVKLDRETKQLVLEDSAKDKNSISIEFDIRN